jgi:Tol biopolymer transport system component
MTPRTARGSTGHTPPARGSLIGMTKHVPFLVLVACTHPTPTAVAPTGVLFIRVLDPTQPGPFPIGNIFVHTDHGDEQLTTTGDYAFPAWSIDGAKIAFTTLRDGNGEIWVMDADGSHETRVSDAAPQKYSVMPSWSPDGTIVFTWGFDAAVVRPGEFTAPRTIRSTAMFGSFSRDGAKIVYTTKLPESDRTHNEIFTMNADGSDPTQLTFSDDVDAPDANASSWSPDGKTVAFFCGHEGDLPPDELDPYYREGKQQVCLIDADGGNRRTLTQCTMCGSDNPGWSPDGAQVFYDRGTYTNGVVTNVIDVDGTNETQLLDTSYGGGRLPWLD